MNPLISCLLHCINRVLVKLYKENKNTLEVQ